MKKFQNWLLMLGIVPFLAACQTTAPTGNAPISYETFGTGPEKVLMVHDWLGDKSNYDPIRSYLDTESFTFAFVDLRGYGNSMDIGGEFTASEAASDIMAVADDLGWDKAHIVGHSMTGMIVQKVAVRYPDRIKSLVATTPVSAAGMQVDKDTHAFFQQIAMDPEVMTQGIGLLTGNKLSAGWAKFKVDRAMSRSTEEARLAYLEMFDKEDFSNEVMGLETPILALLGANDLPPFQPDSINATFGAWYPNLTVIVSSTAGHYPMQETPAFYATVIEAHMKKYMN